MFPRIGFENPLVLGLSIPIPLATHDNFGYLSHWLAENAWGVATVVTAMVAVGLLLEIIPVEHQLKFSQLVARASRRLDSPGATDPAEIDRIHDEEELKHLGRRGPTV